MPFWRWRDTTVGFFCSGLEWRSSFGARDVSCAWFGGHVLPAAFAAVFARRQVRLRSAFAVLFFALKGFFTSRKWLCFCGVLLHFEKGHISCACRALFSRSRFVETHVFPGQFRVGVVCCELLSCRLTVPCPTVLHDTAFFRAFSLMSSCVGIRSLLAYWRFALRSMEELERRCWGGVACFAARGELT